MKNIMLSEALLLIIIGLSLGALLAIVQSGTAKRNWRNWRKHMIEELSLTITIFGLSLGVLLIKVISDIWYRNHQQKLWNNGVNADTNIKWRRILDGHPGGRAYADGCGNVILITYNVDN